MITLKKADGMSDLDFLEQHGTKLPKGPNKHLTDEGYVVIFDGTLTLVMTSEEELAAFRDQTPKASTTRGGFGRTKAQHAARLAKRAWYRVPTEFLDVKE